MKKFLSILITLSVVFSVLPSFQVEVHAASIKYRQTSKDSVPLRNNYGSEYDTVSYITNKGTAFKIVDTAKKWTSLFSYNTWYKIEIGEGLTNNGKYGTFWVWDGNTTNHEHSYSNMVCTKKGCGYAKGVKSEEPLAICKYVIANSVSRREAPYEEGKKIGSPLPRGTSVTISHLVVNSRNNEWYKLIDGSYIYSSNLGNYPSQKKEDKAKTDYNNTPIANRPSFYTPLGNVPKPACFGNQHEYSAGKCVYCNVDYPIKEELVTGKTYKAKKGTVAREKPWKQSKETKTYEEGHIVTVTHKTKYKDETWYKTSDGWVFGLEDVSLKDIIINSAYTFNRMNESFKAYFNPIPSNAAISSITWDSSAPDIATVTSDTGVVTAKKVGDAKISCTVTSKEGKSIVKSFNVHIPQIASYDDWEYSNKSFDYELAKICSGFSALIYTDYNYAEEGNDLLVYKDKYYQTPKKLFDLLQKDNFYYEMKNYYEPTVNNNPAVFATKKYRINNKETSVIYVILSGTTGLEGWQGNMQITGSTYIDGENYHLSFKSAAIDIQNKLDNFVDRLGIQSPIVVVTGHSRGAGVGNILAEWLSDNDTKYGDIYAYLFATPNTTKNPRNLTGVYNICNISDFVTYIPLSSKNPEKGIDWNYKKNGTTVSFDSWVLGNAYSTTRFNLYANKMFKLSAYNQTPEFAWVVDYPAGMRDYMAGKWKTVRDYYTNEKKFNGVFNDGTAYTYFFNGLAPAAANKGGLFEMITHITHACDYNELTCFFAFNEKLSPSFRHSHEMMTYHAAILSKSYDSGQNPSIFSIDLLSEDESTLVQDEHDALYSFFTQNENQLMLETNGWDINDTSTWYGIEWNENGNVTKIDLSYLSLSGWFNANNFPELQDLNLDGNDISMLAVSSCENLVSLSCMSNSLSAISVNNCANLQNLDCSFNQIGNLNLSNMSQLVELNCYGNSINNLNLNGATALQTVRCGNNELSTIDISTNTSLNTFYCGDNRIVESQNSDLVESINTINLNGGSAIIGTQKYNENFEFNEAELTSLTQFANMSLNLEKLGWDLENPYTWQGVEWQIKATEEILDDGTKEVREEYHITSLYFDGLDLEGDLCIPEAEFVESVSCADSSLTTLNLSRCSSLSSINCNNAGISELTIDGCSSLQSINCNDNYLEVESVESSLNQIGLNTGIATYENQNIDAIDECFNEAERMVLIDLLLSGDNTEKLDWDLDWPGTWDGIVWTNVDGEYRVNKIDLAETEVYGILDLTAFEYLEDFNFSGTQIESVTLPDCITQIPEAAFYNSGIETIYMKDGITNIGKSAFAYCENLNSVVLPKTIAKVFDNAFMGSKNLKYVVFTGDEPIQVGVDIFYDVSPEFNLVYFASATWNEDSEILSNCNYIVSNDDYIILLDKPTELKPDDYYHETNTYAGDEVTFTVATKTTGTTATSMLAVYTENGALDSLVSTPITLDNYLNVVTFEDVNIQYVGEEYCKIKTFLWDDANTIKPIADAVEKLLIKPIIE